MNLYVIFDRTAGECSDIFEAKNDGVATRRFNLAMERAHQSSIADFRLLQVGSIDREACVVTPVVPAKEVLPLQGEVETVLNGAKPNGR